MRAISSALQVNSIEKSNAYFEKLESVEKFNDVPVVDDNPFAAKLMEKMEMKRVRKGAKNGVASVSLTNEETGEVVSGIQENRVFMKQEVVDSEKFVKLYIHRFAELYDLGVSAQKVFGYFLVEMQKPINKDRDIIFFNMSDCMDFCKYKTNPMIYTGLTELIKHKFIAKSSKHPGHFYVDANTAFNGKRVIIMEEYIKEDSEMSANQTISQGLNTSENF